MRRFVMLALWIALAAMGGILKVPVGFGSIALDSAPAILASLFLGPMAGGLVAGAGHFLSALTGGFPLGPFHLIIGQTFYITIAPSLLIGALCNIGVTILVLPKLQANFSAIYKMEG
ncbi:ECF transporter S component [Pontibacillus salicampi]|uniref:ECF transporter S component n=1 Tax=Pontibacillus salicampi TaxID=1449801 RepID=A0ABV6LK16_9BACI